MSERMTSSDFAQASSVADRTAALQAAVDAVHREGGGEVRIPPGVWEIATVHLRSGVTLHLPANAVLKASGDIGDYPVSTVQDANKDRQPCHLLVAEDAENITLSGDGVIDGNGFAFWHEPMKALADRGIDVTAYKDAERVATV